MSSGKLQSIRSICKNKFCVFNIWVWNYWNSNLNRNAKDLEYGKELWKEQSGKTLCQKYKDYSVEKEVSSVNIAEIIG